MQHSSLKKERHSLKRHGLRDTPSAVEMPIAVNIDRLLNEHVPVAMHEQSRTRRGNGPPRCRIRMPHDEHLRARAIGREIARRCDAPLRIIRVVLVLQRKRVRPLRRSNTLRDKAKRSLREDRQARLLCPAGPPKHSARRNSYLANAHEANRPVKSIRGHHNRSLPPRREVCHFFCLDSQDVPTREGRMARCVDAHVDIRTHKKKRAGGFFRRAFDHLDRKIRSVAVHRAVCRHAAHADRVPARRAAVRIRRADLRHAVRLR